MFAAIPFFQLGVYNWHVPGTGIVLPIDAWATLVCVGIVVGLEVARARAIKLGLEVKDIVDGAAVIVGMGFVVAHIVTVVFYKPERLAEEGIWAILKIWEGFASSGGFLGAVIGAWLFYRVIRKRPALRHADVICFGFPFGWFFGRMGCGVVHDHVGIETDFFLAMHFPPGHWAAGVRHELGLYEMLYMVPVMALFWWWGRIDRVPGWFLGWFAVLYAPARLGLDFLRESPTSGLDANLDMRWYGMTAAQWGMFLLFFAGAALLWTRDYKGFQPHPMDGTPAGGPPEPEPSEGDAESAPPAEASSSESLEASE